MPLIVPFAAPPPELAPALLPALRLPALQSLLAHATVTRDDGHADSLSPPHERALARALGFAGADGALPLAAWLAGQDGLDTGDLAWGLLTPVHCQVGMESVVVTDPDALALDAAASRAFFDLVKPLFEEEGHVLLWGAPLRWYAAHESLRHWRAASLDRAIGRPIDPRAGGEQPAARALRRLQNEVQMLLHEHPLNEAREAAGLAPVNSFWLGGCGVRQPVRPGAAVRIDDHLRGPALAGDWAAWQAAWAALDAGPLAAMAGQGGELVLCGERSAATLSPAPVSPWQRIKAGLGLKRAGTPADLLASL